jgi:predicted small lipoprotein YifL
MKRELSAVCVAAAVVAALTACGGTGSEIPAAELALAATENAADLDSAAMAAEGDSETAADARRQSMGVTATAVSAAAPMPGQGVTPTATAEAAQNGVWSAPFDTGLIGIHLNVLADGSLMYYGADVDNTDRRGFDTRSLRVATLKPDDTFVEYPDAVSVASFCTGNLTLSDGRVLLTGGTTRFPEDSVNPVDAAFGGATLLATFSRGDSAVQRLGGGLAKPRWYPTNVMTPGGDSVVVLGGLDDNGIPVTNPEVVDVKTGATRLLSGADVSVLGFSYPRAVSVGDGEIVALSRAGAPYLLSTSGAGSITALRRTAGMPTGPMAPIGLGRYLISGSYSARAGVATTRIADISRTGMRVSSTGDMGLPRNYHELTTLPDGSVLASGGTDGQATPTHHLAAERWVAGKGWTTMAAAQLKRGYHSTAALLPDATVIKMGSTRPVQKQAEVFYPPYLFNADGTPRKRPAIESLNRTGTDGRADIEVVMATDGAVSAVSLVRTASTTHQTDMGQAFVVPSYKQDGRRLTITIPANTAWAPAGVYWVFVMDANGTPSMARAVRIG